MANPRKFSEKIALHTHRQAEETARFEQIMKEVLDVTARDEAAAVPVVNRPGSRARSQGGPIRRHDRRLDTSPYSSNTFLSPPHDTSWRRTHSDSSLHQSAMQDKGLERNDNCDSRWMMSNMNGPERNEGRPRSSCEVPRVPGIHIYPSAHVPGIVQIPISGNNTGSLPDLTNVNFSSPIRVPLDQDIGQSSSPYSSSPVNTSPSTLSPTSISQGGRPSRFHFTPNSPLHSNHLSVPRYANQPNKNIPVENNCNTDEDFTHLTGLSGMYQQQTCPPSSPSPTLPPVSGYRSPKPSPQSSPSIGGRHSAPCSPGAPSPLANDYILQHNFHQQFGQLSVLDSPVNSMQYDPSGGSSTHQSHNQTVPEVSTVNSGELASDPGYYSTSESQLVYPSSMHTTPNTPTSIPDIILTDFSSGAEDGTREDMNKQLENQFFHEESLREYIEPLNYDELQMLADSTINFISDGVEDGFRLHRS